MLKTGMVTKLLAVMLLAAAVFCAVAGPAAAQSKKAPVEQLAEELDLTYVQIMDLKTVFEEYTKKKKELGREEDAGAPPEETLEKQQRLQREFYEELSRILTPEQIEKYKEFTQRGRSAKPDAGKPGKPGKIQPVDAVFPWIGALKQAVDQTDISGLQKQAFGDLFTEMESRAAQMLYWDPEYLPEEDLELVNLLQSKLMWILTGRQHQEFVGVLNAVLEGRAPELEKAPAEDEEDLEYSPYINGFD